VTAQDLLTTVLLIVTMILWGTTPLLEKIGLQTVDPLTGVLVRSMSITGVLLVVYGFAGRLPELAKISMKNFLLFGASGLMAGLLGMWTYYLVLKSGAMSKIVPIAAAYPLITALIAILVLREGVSLQRIIGICLTILGIVLVKQS